MRRRAARVKLSATIKYKVRNLGDIGDARRATSGSNARKYAVCFTLDFAIASTNSHTADQFKKLPVVILDGLDNAFGAMFQRARSSTCPKRQRREIRKT
jgi:hypothetical protein